MSDCIRREPMAREMFRKELGSVKPYVPGKPIDDVKREYGLERVEKLASNENPIGPSPLAVEAMRGELAHLNLYPDPGCVALREAIAAELGLSPDQLVAGNGGEHLLNMVATAFIGPGDEAVMSVPSFDVYAQSVGLMGGNPVQVPLKDNKHDLEAYLERIGPRTKLVYLCNPNNPTGSISTRAEVEAFVSRLDEDIILLIDEAYYEYAKARADYPSGLDILRRRPSTLVLRTFSKIAGIAGIRVGYLAGSKEIISELGKVKGTFYVNRLAQAAAIGALKDREHIQKTVALNAECMRLMKAWFDAKGLAYVDSAANFIFVDTGRDSMKLFEDLMRRGIIVRPGALWGYRTWLRVSTGSLEQTQAFLSALGELL
ncbi:MAG TPA: histidinol-phosphate transaminase [Rectinemataceae bacterium]|nr:histidinol-phosphate transaminase [Rectinemataceae bacterium]